MPQKQQPKENITTIKYSEIANEFIKSSTKFKDEDLPLYTNIEGKKYVLGFGNFGNGTTVWNFLDETHNDYTTVAHIDNYGKVKIYDEALPETAKEYLEHYVENSNEKNFNENPLKNTEMSTEQNFNMIDGIINNENKKSVISDLKTKTPIKNKGKITIKKELER